MSDESPTRTGDDPGAPANKAFAAQRNRIRQLENEVEDLRTKLDERETDGDPNTSALKRQIRELESRLDQVSLQGIDEDQLEEVMALYPWIKSIGKKVDRIQAVKDIIAQQQAGTKAGAPDKGRTKSEAAAAAHLTGGGPPATGGSHGSDEERDLAEYRKKMREAKTQKERDAIADDWHKKHPDEARY